jgi:hypothetical protein
MSLKLSNFGQWIQGGEPIDYLEIRLGEQYTVPITFTDAADPPQPINITGWTFTTTTEVYTATFAYNAAGDLVSVSNFTDQGTANAYAGLGVTVINAAAGQAVLTIPAGVNPNPSALVTADSDNTMLNIITIAASWPGTYYATTGLANIRKLMIGLVVRFGS